MRPRLGEALISAGAMIVLLLVLVAADDRVRDQVSLRLSNPSAEISSAGQQVGNITHVVVQAARHQSLEHAPMLIFGLVATVLTLFMLRT
jgi:hypothetical protein